MKLMKCCDYTLAKNCKKCGAKTKSAHPPRFSVADKYGKYRRMAKQKSKDWNQ